MPRRTCYRNRSECIPCEEGLQNKLARDRRIPDARANGSRLEFRMQNSQRVSLPMTLRIRNRFRNT